MHACHAPERLANGPIMAIRRRLASRSGSSGSAPPGAPAAPSAAASPIDPAAAAACAALRARTCAPCPAAAAEPVGMFLSRTMLLAAASLASARCSRLPTTLAGMRRKGLSSPGPSKWPSAALQRPPKPAQGPALAAARDPLPMPQLHRQCPWVDQGRAALMSEKTKVCPFLQK